MEAKAILRTARISPQKARLVADQVRGLPAERAVNLLKFSDKKAAARRTAPAADSPRPPRGGRLTAQERRLAAERAELRAATLKRLEKSSGKLATAAMAMTQSAASKSLQELEGMLEAPLFERSRRGMRPNAFGHCVIRHARQLVADLSAMCEEVAGIRAGSVARWLGVRKAWHQS